MRGSKQKITKKINGDEDLLWSVLRLLQEFEGLLLTDSETTDRISAATRYLYEVASSLIESGYPSTVDTDRSWLQEYFPTTYPPVGDIESVEIVRLKDGVFRKSHIIMGVPVPNLRLHFKESQQTSANKNLHESDLKTLRASAINTGIDILKLESKIEDTRKRWRGEFTSYYSSIVSKHFLEKTLHPILANNENVWAQTFRSSPNGTMTFGYAKGGFLRRLFRFCLKQSFTFEGSNPALRKILDPIIKVSNSGELVWSNDKEIHRYFSNLSSTSTDEFLHLATTSLKSGWQHIESLNSQAEKEVGPAKEILVNELQEALKQIAPLVRKEIVETERLKKLVWIEMPEIHFIAGDNFERIFVGPQKKQFDFNPTQAACFEVLFEAFKIQEFHLHQEGIIDDAYEILGKPQNVEDRVKRLNEIFRNKITQTFNGKRIRANHYHKAWNTVIKKHQPPKGHYQLSSEFFPRESD